MTPRRLITSAQTAFAQRRSALAPRRVASRFARETSGVTLIEMLVAIVTGIIVTGAAFTILEFSLKQTSRIADRTSANQRGRIAMEKIQLELHSSCVTILVNPVQAESTATKLIFLSHTAPSAEPFFTSMTEHEIVLVGTTLNDNVYNSTGGTEATGWKFSKAKVSSTTVLLTGVSAPSSGPMFEYLRYTGTSLSTLLAAPELSLAESKLAAQVNIRLFVSPESGVTKGPVGDRQFEVSDSAVLRLTPATAVGQDEPCE
jgi:hypothetical protein